MRSHLLITAGLLTGVFVATSALAQEMKPEELLKARQGMMEAVRYQLGPIFGAAKGAVPLSAATVEAAENVVGIAHALKSVYGSGTADLPGSNAKPEAFTDPKFLAGYDKLADAAAKVAADAKANNLDALKADVGAIGGACKGCHDDFRKKI
jgi:cytochrome c556